MGFVLLDLITFITIYTGDDSDSTMEDENHWSNHKGLALLAGLSVQHGSGTSTPVKGSNSSTPSKPKKSSGSHTTSSKQSEKVKGATPDGSGTEIVKKKSKSKKRSSSKGSSDGEWIIFKLSNCDKSQTKGTLCLFLKI